MRDVMLERAVVTRHRAPPISEPALRLMLTLVLFAALVVLVLLPVGAILSKSLEDQNGAFVGLGNFSAYLGNPSLTRSIGNSLLLGALTTTITVSLAFLYAYALSRSCMPLKPLFRGIGLLPVLSPSLLPAIALTYLFGNQGFLRDLLGGASIYGLSGIVVAQVFYCFPHALLILTTALALSDARLYEAAEMLGASRGRMFRTITLPGARFGLISAVFVVFTIAVTDFGVAKVIGGQFNVLSIDIYKQVIGQQNFRMGAVVGVLLLLPAVLSFGVDLYVRRRQKSMLSVRAVVLVPEQRRGFDLAMLAAAGLVALFILVLVGTALFASFVKFWPYDLSLSLGNYDFAAYDAAGWSSYGNSLTMAAWTALIGTVFAFGGAYLVEKGPGLALPRALYRALAVLPLAVPGLVLGLGYIFFFNSPSNPLNGVYGGLSILVMSTIAHYYTVPHLMAVTALKQIDDEIEEAAAALGVPFWQTFSRVTLPICAPTVIDIATYFFLNAMTTIGAVVFLYAPATKLASVAVVEMDDTGDTAAAAAMAVMILLTAAAVKLLQMLLTSVILRRTQVWRLRRDDGLIDDAGRAPSGA
ncbi:MAG TPA: putative 2-aminoethylphosphonate ABC transporter permease subunit [Bosea sp. (in: a-proteobacteria)]|jgi:iron(III) transport system permease protein|uniref:putative 2-aminoethylphosphonate ABC transporter permease subunit n=1 Tax=Bosea sp. (in: a-proteobacteria) TaxID=1871050 RepID=UPI002E121CD0|nr:putative 2-aminoethylphosphonate ABC transporter permease subunit [Bosea sp. (in: a-proteobacteria)]